MKKTLILATGALAAALLVAGQANALTLTNRGAGDQRLKIITSGDEAVTQDVVILAEETLSDVCMDGCKIALENGDQKTFEGNEVVYIEHDKLVIAE
ncbi:MAG: hypothetical protein OEL78_06870 [Hyphomicrobiales bacterium]|nr:hypothetical protein [Hyphomicrobiales bacterium]